MHSGRYSSSSIWPVTAAVIAARLGLILAVHAIKHFSGPVRDLPSLGFQLFVRFNVHVNFLRIAIDDD